MNRNGFTLVEMIVVMAMITVVMAVTAPRLARFFQGQSIDEEIRRFMALLQFAKQEAISTSVPVDLYIDINTGLYGITATAGYKLDENKKIEFQLDSALRFEVFTQERMRFPDDIVHIVYMPDGFLDDASVKALRIVPESTEEQSKIIAQSNVGIGYKLLPESAERDIQKLYDTLPAQGL